MNNLYIIKIITDLENLDQKDKYQEEICKRTCELKLLEKLYKKFENKEIYNLEQDSEYE
ncbi:20076_t:CDS:2, partial [Racocetra fulgida]